MKHASNGCAVVMRTEKGCMVPGIACMLSNGDSSPICTYRHIAHRGAAFSRIGILCHFINLFGELHQHLGLLLQEHTNAFLVSKDRPEAECE